MIEAITVVCVFLSKYWVYLLIAPLSYLVREISKQKPTRKPGTQKQSKRGPKAYDAVRPATRQKLIAMCGGDMALVSRLAGNTQSSWEKAIYDLERDRR